MCDRAIRQRCHCRRTVPGNAGDNPGKNFESAAMEVPNSVCVLPCRCACLQVGECCGEKDDAEGDSGNAGEDPDHACGVVAQIEEGGVLCFHGLAKSVRGTIEAQTGVEIAVDAARFLDQVDAAPDAAFSAGK